MEQAPLCDRIARGLGAAARRIGAPHDLHRPTGARDPMAPATRILRLHAAFNAEDPAWRKPRGYGSALWHGVFDTAYTRPGDVLLGPGGAWFVAEQEPLLAPLLVRCNRTVDLLRPEAPASAGLNGYGGVTRAGRASLLAGWPASVLAAGHAGGDRLGLPTDARVAAWQVLLPRLPAGALAGPIRPGDQLADEAGRGFTVSSAEETALGWRIAATLSTSS